MSTLSLERPLDKFSSLIADPGNRNSLPPRVNTACPAPALRLPGSRFMAGLPTKLATKRFTGLRYTSAGGPNWWINPSRMMAMSSDITMASSWSWVTKMVVPFISLWIRLISVRISTRRAASRLESGSSNRNTAGLRTMARPRATR